jgi:7,8-dihydro-6-hydroxymethylpterin-pyrophosphokinase
MLRLNGESTIQEFGAVGAVPGYLSASLLCVSTLSVQNLLGLAKGVEERIGDPQKPGARQTIRIDLMWVEGVEVKTPDLELPNPMLDHESWAIGTFVEAAEEAVTNRWQIRRFYKALQTVPPPHEISGGPFVMPEPTLERDRAGDTWIVLGRDWPDALASSAELLGRALADQDNPDTPRNKMSSDWDVDVTRVALERAPSSDVTPVDVPLAAGEADADQVRSWMTAVGAALAAAPITMSVPVVFAADGASVRGAIVGGGAKAPRPPPAILRVVAERTAEDKRYWARLHSGVTVPSRVAVTIAESFGQTGPRPP